MVHVFPHKYIYVIIHSCLLLRHWNLSRALHVGRSGSLWLFGPEDQGARIFRNADNWLYLPCIISQKTWIFSQIPFKLAEVAFPFQLLRTEIFCLPLNASLSLSLFSDYNQCKALSSFETSVTPMGFARETHNFPGLIWIDGTCTWDPRCSRVWQ